MLKYAQRGWGSGGVPQFALPGGRVGRRTLASPKEEHGATRDTTGGRGTIFILERARNADMRI